MPQPVKPVLQYLGRRFIKEHPSLKAASASIGAKSSSSISLCCNGYQKTAFCYRWRYKRDIYKEKMLLKKLNKSNQTTVSREHWHNYTIDEEGNGKTFKTFPSKYEEHMHEIVLEKMEFTDGHRHKLL